MDYRFGSLNEILFESGSLINECHEELLFEFGRENQLLEEKFEYEIRFDTVDKEVVVDTPYFL
jgi:hypothetical protein